VIGPREEVKMKLLPSKRGNAIIPGCTFLRFTQSLENQAALRCGELQNSLFRDHDLLSELFSVLFESEELLAVSVFSEPSLALGLSMALLEDLRA
jgi:hypothetical protein